MFSLLTFAIKIGHMWFKARGNSRAVKLGDEGERNEERELEDRSDPFEVDELDDAPEVEDECCCKAMLMALLLLSGQKPNFCHPLRDVLIISAAQTWYWPLENVRVKARQGWSPLSASKLLCSSLYLPRGTVMCGKSLKNRLSSLSSQPSAIGKLGTKREL